jgi:hypothetical protein
MRNYQVVLAALAVGLMVGGWIGSTNAAVGVMGLLLGALASEAVAWLRRRR